MSSLCAITFQKAFKTHSQLKWNCISKGTLYFKIYVGNIIRNNKDFY